MLEPLIYQCKFPDARWCPCRCCVERRCCRERKRRKRGDAQGGEQELCSCSPASSPVAAFAHARRHHSLAHVRASGHPGSAGGLRLSLSLSAIGLGPNLPSLRLFPGLCLCSFALIYAVVVYRSRIADDIWKTLPTALQHAQLSWQVLGDWHSNTFSLAPTACLYITEGFPDTPCQD